MSRHEDRRAFIDAIRDSAPDDQTPSLVFADWCDENGEPVLAESIRLYCELERAGLSCRETHLGGLDLWRSGFIAVCDCESCGAARKWLAVWESPGMMPYRKVAFGMVGKRWIRHGLVMRCTGLLANWVRWGKELVDQHPVAELELTCVTNIRYFDHTSFLESLKRTGVTVTQVSGPRVFYSPSPTPEGWRELADAISRACLDFTLGRCGEVGFEFRYAHRQAIEWTGPYPIIRPGLHPSPAAPSADLLAGSPATWRTSPP